MVAVEQTTDTGSELQTGVLFKATTLAQHSRDHTYNWIASMERKVSKQTPWTVTEQHLAQHRSCQLGS